MMSERAHVFFSMYCGHSLLTWSIPQVFTECLAYARNSAREWQQRSKGSRQRSSYYRACILVGRQTVKE